MAAQAVVELKVSFTFVAHAALRNVVRARRTVPGVAFQTVDSVTVLATRFCNLSQCDQCTEGGRNGFNNPSGSFPL